ncbi:MAG: hypothetical protein QOF94_1860 [Acidobacteriaceae bacterium]
MALDRKDLASKFSEQSGDVAGTSANFQYLVGGLELEGLEHDCDDVRLRDGLAVADWQRMIFVGLGTVGSRNKFVTGNAKHGLEDAGIGDAAVAELRTDHKLAGGGWVGHGFSQFGFRECVGGRKISTSVV